METAQSFLTYKVSATYHEGLPHQDATALLSTYIKALNKVAQRLPVRHRLHRLSSLSWANS